MYEPILKQLKNFVMKKMITLLISAGLFKVTYAQGPKDYAAV